MAATSQAIAQLIEYHVGKEQMTALRVKFGSMTVDCALDEAGSFHAGCEEIGSSDIFYMVQSFLSRLSTVELHHYGYISNMVNAVLHGPIP